MWLELTLAAKLLYYNRAVARKKKPSLLAAWQACRYYLKKKLPDEENVQGGNQAAWHHVGAEGALKYLNLSVCPVGEAP